ncbi:hypothetical protein SLEP1_g59568 [Rubroshorea leprosula]|uniref:Uncharacterized protein n=1 Tax=Rubroshorea leprosula TaxID=152421 RepID=A0AAV5MVY1_9ROSI|nr:hypothetical protein SLEP1_g59568 [Rubroshorea leprosula]
MPGTMVKVRQSRLQANKWLTMKNVLSMLFMLTVGLLILLALGIFSLPLSNDDSPPNDLTTYRRKVFERANGLGKRDEQWTEVISWEPRAFVYHNFLVCLLYFLLKLLRDVDFYISFLNRVIRSQFRKK